MILGTILVHGILEVIYEMDFRRFSAESAVYDLWRCCGNLCADHENGSSGI